MDLQQSEVEQGREAASHEVREPSTANEYAHARLNGKLHTLEPSKPTLDPARRPLGLKDLYTFHSRCHLRTPPPIYLYPSLDDISHRLPMRISTGLQRLRHTSEVSLEPSNMQPGSPRAFTIINCLRRRARGALYTLCWFGSLTHTRRFAAMRGEVTRGSRRTYQKAYLLRCT